MAPGAPGPPRPPRPRGSFKRGLRRALREPFTRRTGRECLYAGVSLLVAIPLFAFTAVAVAVGLALSVSFAGLPLLALSLRAARRLGAFCRRLANRALGSRTEPPPLFRPRQVRPIEAPPPFRPQPGLDGLDPVEPDRLGRLAGVRLPAAQASDRGARRHRADLHRCLGGGVHHVPGLVGAHPPARRARRCGPGARVDRVVDAEPGARRPVGALPGGVLRAGSGRAERAGLGPVDGQRVQRPRPDGWPPGCSAPR